MKPLGNVIYAKAKNFLVSFIPTSTRGDGDELFLAWTRSPAFAEGHRAALETARQRPEPLPLTAELWSYEVELAADGSDK